MEIILVPGFWLDASSWDAVTPPLVAAGHRVVPVTPAGAEAENPRRAEVTLRDQVDDVVALIDDASGRVVLVGHSGGAAVVHAALDARPDGVARAIYVDAVPLGAGGVINDELPVVDGLVPLPDWDVFDDDDLVGLTPDLREHFRSIAVPIPAAVASGVQELSDERRYDVPVTVIACEFSSRALSEMFAAEHPWHSYVHELSLLTDLRWIDLPTGHWPQLSRPADLGAAILAAVDGGGVRDPEAVPVAGGAPGADATDGLGAASGAGNETEIDADPGSGSESGTKHDR